MCLSRIWWQLNALYYLILVVVDDLQNHGINAADITKLKQTGICTVQVSLSSSTRVMNDAWLSRFGSGNENKKRSKLPSLSAECRAFK